MEGHVSAVARELQEIFENLKDRRVRQRKVRSVLFPRVLNSYI